ncbi:MAG TPA: hypothetical protein VMU94_27100 [Streptosporangiaceae bacterium]|nr:hypothetical protein [Streptosporangiaceae bacterium]
MADLTILILDDVATAAGRAETRDGRQFTADQQGIHDRAVGMFALLAADHPGRFRIIDRRHVTIQVAVAQSTSWLADLRDQLTGGLKAS